jgi:hypothetical protein
MLVPSLAIGMMGIAGSVANAAGATGPVISNVSIKSNSAKGPTKATIGDIITLTFTTDEPVTKLSNFKINSSNPDTFTNVGNDYTATHLVDSGDPITGVPATFQINVKNATGIFSQTIEVTNDGTSVTIVDQKPVISSVSIKSNNADPTKARNGDIITLTFTTDEPVTKLSNFKINSSNPDTFTNVGNNYTATHLVDSGDPITGVPATFQINVKNAAGIFSQTIEATNDGSSVTIIPFPVLSAEDFGVVSFDTGLGFLKGYTAGFGLTGANFASSSVMMQLFASSTLLQTNSSTPKVGATITGVQISSPFDVSGNFDYVADGFWNNVREAEFGQHLAATRVVATVTLADGTVLTAENDNPTGDPATIMPTGMLNVQKIALGGTNTFSFTGDNGLGSFTITTATSSATSTTSMGSSTFSVASGTYTITEATTTGWTIMSNDCTAVAVAATGTTTCTITNAKLGEIKGMKFEDENGNGAAMKNDEKDGDHGASTMNKDGNGSHGDGDKDNNDNDNEENNVRHGIAGVSIFLDANNNGVLDAGEMSTTTDANGNYDFMGLVPALYHVREVVQPGWMQTVPASGVYDIMLAPGQVSAKNDFGNFKLGSISGMKFNDMNGNGKKDAGEPGLAGWTIMLSGPTGMAATSTMTDASGTYSFSNLGPGTYNLSEVMKAGWVQTMHPGSVRIRSGVASMNDNFGNHLGPVPAPKGNKGRD